MGLIRELKDFVRFFWGTPSVEKQIVFYAEHEGYYVTFEGLVDELNRKGAYPFCYVTSDEKDPILQKSRSEIHIFYFNVLKQKKMLFVPIC